MPVFRLVMKVLLALLFIGAGINHFRDPDFYVRMIENFLPWPLELVYISGVFEAQLGVLLLVPRYSRDAAWGLIALLIAVFPANIYMALEPDKFPRLPAWTLWLRLPLQGVLVAWAYWFTRPAGTAPQRVDGMASGAASARGLS